MCLVVHLGQVLEVEVGVNLGRTDVRVAQHFLDTSEVAARLQQVGRKAVPQGVRGRPAVLG